MPNKSWVAKANNLSPLSPSLPHTPHTHIENLVNLKAEFNHAIWYNMDTIVTTVTIVLSKRSQILEDK